MFSESIVRSRDLTDLCLHYTIKRRKINRIQRQFLQIIDLVIQNKATIIDFLIF